MDSSLITQNGTPEAEEATLEKMRDEHREQQDKLESNAEGVLAKLRGGSTSEPEPEPNPEPEPKSEPESDPQSEPKSESEPEPEPESEPELAGKEPEPTDDEHALTQAEVRAAIHSGWSQEDIDELVKVNPELAKKSCTKALESQNNLSKKFSELGKTQAAQQTEPAVPTTPTQTPQPKSIDFTALEKEYENDPIVGVLKQVVEQNQTLATEVGTLRDVGAQGDVKVTAAQVQHDAAISQQIEGFFESPEVTAYKDTYGEVEKGSKDWDNLTQGQIKKRYEVVEEANRIMIGAQKMEQNMPLDEAFERAHFLVTKDVQEAAIRKTIKAKATKRSKSLTLAPTDSVKVVDTGKKTMAKTLANAEKTLAELREGR